MKRLTRYGLAAALLALAACGGSATGPSEDILGTTWRLRSVQRNGTLTPWSGDPELFTLRLGKDGQISLRDNCNGCGSRYTLAGDMLDVRNLACTLAACASPGPGGPDDFTSLIEGTNRLAVERNELIVSSSQATLRFGR